MQMKSSRSQTLAEGHVFLHYVGKWLEGACLRKKFEHFLLHYIGKWLEGACLPSNMAALIYKTYANFQV